MLAKDLYRLESLPDYNQTILKKPHIRLDDLQKAWREILGSVSERSIVVNFDRGQLYVIVTDSVVQQQLTFHTQDVIDKINLRYGGRLVKEIVFRMGKYAPKLIYEYENLPPCEERIPELKVMPYQQYLDSLEWKSKAKRKKESNGRCQLCNSPDNLHVHHRTYERRGEEHLDDLTVLCAKCHELFHTHSELYVESEQS